MAAPVVTPHQQSTGFKMGDGYYFRYVFQNKPNIALWEVTGKPPGLDGGELIDNTSMQNTHWRTRRTRHLITLTPSECTCYFDPDVFPDLLLMLNEEQSVTFWYPDNSAEAFFGAMTKAEWGEFREGDPPTVVVTVSPTNYDPVNGVEAAPVFQPAAGT